MWNTTKIENMEGKVIIITGANSGIGFHVTRVLAGKNATVVLASRNEEKAKKALKKISDEYKSAKLKYINLDLADLNSIIEFSKKFKSQFNRLDVLCNNAGVMWFPYKKTVDGFELQFGTNHLGHFALTGNLLDYLLKTENSRVITMSSIAHFTGKIDFSDINDEKQYNRYSAYSKSKLSNLLFAFELQRKFDEHNINSLSIATHPGIARTNLFNSGTAGEKNIRHYFHKTISFLFGQTAYLGSIPMLRAAMDEKIKGGKYYGPLILGLWGWAVRNFSSPRSHNKKLAQKLWEISEKLTGVTYKFN